MTFYDFDTMSTTPVHPEVLAAYQALLNNYYANSESLHSRGREINELLNQARQQVASLLMLEKHEVIFTSGASEANNLAIKGYAWAKQERGKHLITSAIEHASVLNSFKQLEQEFGFNVTYLPVNQAGLISLTDLKQAINKETTLVSIMAVNNELGTIEPVNEISQFLKKEHPRIALHVDAVQAVGKIDLALSDFDLITLSAHKINGLKGSGILLKRPGIALIPLISGGNQEQNYRAGTVDALTQIMWAKTLRLALKQQAAADQKVRALNHYLRQQLLAIPGVIINSPLLASPYILNLSILALPSEVTLNALNNQQILVSAASTCSGKTYQASHVLSAIGLSDKLKKHTIRIGLAASHTNQDLDYLVTSLKEVINQYGQF